jgi:translation initiation factor 3 subunit D
VAALPNDESSWGPPSTTPENGLLDGVPYAPYSKGDKLGRMADWATDSKDGRDNRGRQNYGRGFRGMSNRDFFSE